MGVIARKQKGVYMANITKLAVVSLISGLAFAFANTIWAVYIDSFVHNASIVGFISLFFTVVAFISFFVFIPVIEKYDKAKIYSTALLFMAVLYAFLAIFPGLYSILIFGFFLTIFITLMYTSYGILVRDNSKNKELSRNEGLVYTFMNISFLIGPLIAGFIAFKYSSNMVFALASFFVLMAFILFKTTKISDPQGKKNLDTNIVKNFVDFFKSRDRVVSYFMGSGVNLWWVFCYVFIPLFILNNNLSKLWIGYFLFAVAVPLVLLEFVFAKLAGKVGFKKMFAIGYFIPCILALACFFVSNIFAILFLVVLGSIGMAMIEPTTEAYFFDILKGKEKYRFYSPYNTAVDTGQIIGKLIPSLVLLVLPFKFIFLVFSFFMFLLFLLSFKTKNITER